MGPPPDDIPSERIERFFSQSGRATRYFHDGMSAEAITIYDELEREMAFPPNLLLQRRAYLGVVRIADALKTLQCCYDLDRNNSEIAKELAELTQNARAHFVRYGVAEIRRGAGEDWRRTFVNTNNELINSGLASEIYYNASHHAQERNLDIASALQALNKAVATQLTDGSVQAGVLEVNGLIA